MGKFSVLNLGRTALAAMICVSLTAACDSNSAGTGSTTSTKSNADLLKAAAADMKVAKSYHMDIKVNSAGQDITMGGDLDLANNKSKLQATSPGGSIVQIKIGSDSYTSSDGGTTYTAGDGGISSGADAFVKIWDSFKPEEIDQAKDSIKDGTPKDETLGSDATRHVTVKSSDLQGLSTVGGGFTDGTVDMWLTTGDSPVVRKMKMVGKSNGNDVSADVEWIGVNQSITIEAPQVSTP